MSHRLAELLENAKDNADEADSWWMLKNAWRCKRDARRVLKGLNKRVLGLEKRSPNIILVHPIACGN